MEKVLQDDRFSHITKDPRFRQMSKREKKIKIDNRFKGMFSDKKFKLKYSVDKRGRPIKATTNENLRKFYELSDDDDSDFEDKNSESENDEVKNKQIPLATEDRLKEKDLLEEEKTNKERSKKKNLKIKYKSEEEEDSDFDTESETLTPQTKLLTSKIREETKDTDLDLARGEGNIESSSDEDEDSEDDEEENDEELDHQWGELDKNVQEAKELSRRLAVCNMDWDRIKAQDIFVSLNSFKPPNGVVHSVKIYPSEYGIERMKEEAVKGPTELVEDLKKQQNVNDNDLDTEDTEGNKYHRERLRQYQLNRLKYYYAVVECDSIQTANHIYDECDGLEYERSAARLDLRFIPDDMEFEHKPKSVCTEMPSASTYKPSLFFSSALCQSKVDLTWDETDKDRVNITMKKIAKKDEIKEDDFKAYLADSSDEEGPAYYGALGLDDEEEQEESEDEEAQIDKYRKLAQNIKEEESRGKTRDIEMEISWEPGLKEATEKIIKKKEESKNSTPWEEYLAKKKEKKRKIREERKKKKSDNKSSDEEQNTKEAEDDTAFSDDELPADVDLEDPYFSELKDETTTKDKKKGKKMKKKKGKLIESVKEVDKRKQKEAELALLMMDETEDTKRHFSLKNLIEDGKKKKKKKKRIKDEEKDKNNEDNFSIDVKDERFNAVYTSHLYNIDPSAPEFKKTKAMDAVIKEKLRRREKRDLQKGDTEISNASVKRQSDMDNVEFKSKKRKESLDSNLSQIKDQSLDSLVKSVKLKTQKFKNKSKT